MTSPDIPTPETDEAAYDAAIVINPTEVVPADFARDLERRLAAATARAEKAERIIRNGEEQTAALKRLVPFCHHPANLVIGSAEGWICCECWAQQNEDALRKIAALPTDQTASPTQCEAVLIAMDALEASPSVRPDELQSKLTAAATARAEEAERWKSEALRVEREWDPQELAKMLGGTLGESCRMVVQREVPRLLSELDRLRKEREWQPIETAPKDGSRVLVTGSFRDVGEASYSNSLKCWYWRAEDKIVKPTHWMPLPAAPKQEEGEA